MKKPIVSVVMITYGHAKFINEAIESVLMQECNFDVELIIANDKTPDNTDSIVKKIIKEHPKKSWIKYTNHEKNFGMTANFIWALKQAKGKYIALCDGDDYWTDPLKLQKQVDFLENNKSYSMVCTNVEIIDSLGDIKRKRFEFENNFDINSEYLLKNNHITTCTSLFRNNVFNLDKNKPNFPDKYMWLALLKNGNCFYLNEITARYRMHNTGVYSSLKEYSKSIKRIEDYKNYRKEFPGIYKQINIQIYKSLFNGVISSIKHQKYKEFKKLLNIVFVK
jgi:glycosyltransferase involved in cell wall biosynthesis